MTAGIGLALGVSGAAFAIGTVGGWVATPDDASERSATRYGLKSTTEAPSREAGVAKIQQQRDDARQMLLIGGVSFGAGLLLPGAWRLAPTMIGAGLMGGGVGTLLTLRGAEQNVAHLPSEQEVQASRLPPISVPTLPPAPAGAWTPGNAPPRVLTLAEQLAAAERR
jgi:hypothetical protein